MNIDEILDLLDELLDRSWSLPLTGGRCVVDAEKVRELIDDIRLNLPTEIKQAKAIVADRGEIITSARREADNLVRKAEERARGLVANEVVVKQAEEKAREILSQAQQNSRQMKQAAQEFADNLLKETEDTLMKATQEVKSTRAALKSAGKNRDVQPAK